MKKPTNEFKRGVRAAIREVNERSGLPAIVRHSLSERLSDLIVKRAKDGSAVGRR